MPVWMGLCRSTVIAVLLMAWLGATNHCVFAAPPQARAAVDQDMPADCPMHANHQQPKQRDKEGGCGDLPCCKALLQATAVANAKLVARPLWLGILVTFFEPGICDAQHSEPPRFCFDDTGPPGKTTFAELVLQRSILAHAPPLSLS